MGSRMVFLMGLQALLWAFLAVLSLWTNDFRYQIPTTSIIAGIVIGSIVGIALGAAITLKQLTILLQKGETHAGLTTWLYAAGVFFVFLAVLIYAAENESTTILVIALNFMFPTAPAIFAVRTFLFASWERKNKKTIFSRSFSTLYALPKTETVT